MQPIAPDEPAPTPLSRARALLARLGPSGPLLVAAVAVPAAGAAALAATAGAWLPWFGQDLASAAAFLGLGVFAAAVCLLPTHATSLVAGFVFGAGGGAALALLVVALAALLGYALLGRLAGASLRTAVLDSPRARLVHDALLGRGALRAGWLIALLRLSPMLPFAATNLLLGALGVRVGTFFVSSLVGITPRAVAMALVGAEMQSFDLAAGPGDGLRLVAVVTTIAVVVVVGRIAKQALQRELGDGGPS
jgi:uncharacterized membrane protein YdjX (TVP38/TMEM64 family)